MSDVYKKQRLFTGFFLVILIVIYLQGSVTGYFAFWNVESVILNSTDLTANTSSTNLTAYADVSLGVGETNLTVWDWRTNLTVGSNPQSIAVLIMPFENDTVSLASGIVRDYSQFGNNGTLDKYSVSNYPAWSYNETAGGSYVFSGSGFNGNKVSISAVMDWRGGGTIEAWVNLNDTFGPILVSYDSLGGDDAMLGFGTYLYYSDYYPDDNKLYFSGVVPTGSQDYFPPLISSSTFLPNQWYHVAVAFDSNGAQMYVNGVLDNSTTGDYRIRKFTDGWTETSIGGNENVGGFVNGTIGGVNIYNVTLTASQIALIYNNSYAKYDTIDSSMLSAGQNWTACATPTNSTGEGNKVCSNNIVILVEPNNAPTWSSNVTIGPSSYNGSATAFNVTWIDDNDNTAFDSALIELNYTGSLANYTMFRWPNSNVSSYNLTFPTGVFSWKVYANDSFNVFNSTTAINLAIQNGTLAMNISGSNTSASSSVNITPSESNGGDLDVNYTFWRNSTLVSSANGTDPSADTTTLSAGTYFYILNSSGGQNWSSSALGSNLTIVVSPVSQNNNPGGGGGGGGSGGSSTKIYNLTINFTIASSVIVNATLGDRFLLPLAGEDHLVRVADIANDHIDIIISSDPISDSIIIGQTKSYDVDVDGKTDLVVTFLSMNNGVVSLKFAKPSEESIQEPQNNTQEESTSGSQPEVTPFPIEIVAIASIALLVILWVVLRPYLVAKKPHKKKTLKKEI